MAQPKDPYVMNIPIEGVDLLAIDRSVFSFLQNKTNLIIRDRKVPVLFGAWERWVQLQGSDDKNLNELRDHKGMLKLPLISIRRGDISPNPTRYVRSENGKPYITFHKRIAQSKFDDTQRVPFSDKWNVGPAGQYRKNLPVYEVYKLPYPMFINIQYYVSFWSSYVSSSNLFHQRIWNNYQPGNIKTDGGFYFYAIFDSSNEDNTEEDFSEGARTYKTIYNLTIEGYLISKSDIEVNRTTSEFQFSTEVESTLDENTTIDDILISLGKN